MPISLNENAWFDNPTSDPTEITDQHLGFLTIYGRGIRVWCNHMPTPTVYMTHPRLLPSIHWFAVRTWHGIARVIVFNTYWQYYRYLIVLLNLPSNKRMINAYQKILCWSLCIFSYFDKLHTHTHKHTHTHTHTHTHIHTQDIKKIFIFFVICCICLLF